jgi:hypothetical protein
MGAWSADVLSGTVHSLLSSKNRQRKELVLQDSFSSSVFSPHSCHPIDLKGSSYITIEDFLAFPFIGDK